ncbi:b106 [miniopterid betaherpesvirus 1]|uniref:B106 n=1 Tax=miniopterid betaherpesvirus 1 TaxID=3070189 RepID=I3VQA0_9BETA|nr:b106 [miniopterid betaherpesvirus 1]AFK83944.1 b106 [miniopterid betaherpesvirus 1]
MQHTDKAVLFRLLTYSRFAASNHTDEYANSTDSFSTCLRSILPTGTLKSWPEINTG